MSTSIRVQLLEAVRTSILDMLSDPSWELATDGSSVRLEPNWSPQLDQDVLVLRLSDFHRSISGTVDSTDPEHVYWDVRSVVRIKAVGARAWSWLQTYLSLLELPEHQEALWALGFSVDVPDPAILDISSMVGDREQSRGEASIRVGCRSVYDRVITSVNTIVVTQQVDEQISLYSADAPEP